jgi:hypothetical protein
MISLLAAVLLCLWVVIATSSGVMLSRKKYLNYLELFFLTNLLVFAAVSVYTTQFSNNKVKNQQGLAVAMVGSVLAIFCGILGYQTFYLVARCKAIKFYEPVRVVLANVVKRKDNARESKASVQMQADISTTTTCSMVEVTERTTPNYELVERTRANNELREPLLASEVHES